MTVNSFAILRNAFVLSILVLLLSEAVLDCEVFMFQLRLHGDSVWIFDDSFDSLFSACVAAKSLFQDFPDVDMVEILYSPLNSVFGEIYRSNDFTEDLIK